MIKLGNGKPELVRWVAKHFKCDDCEAHRKPKAKRPSAVPRSYRFNHVVVTLRGACVTLRRARPCAHHRTQVVRARAAQPAVAGRTAKVALSAHSVAARVGAGGVPRP